MSSVAFDTLKFARALRDKGHFTAQQAEGLVDAMSEALQGDIASKIDLLVVKTDLREAELRLEAQIDATRLGIEATRLGLEAKVEATRLGLEAKVEATRLGLEAQIEATKADIIKWMFGTIGFQTVIILGAVIALSRVVSK